MPTLFTTTSPIRRAAAAAAIAIAIPALTMSTASAETYLPPLTPTEGTTWTEGPCATGAGVTVAVDVQAEGSDAAVVRCAANEDGSAYTNASSTQAFADAGFSVVTKADGMVCLVDDAPDPNPCDEWTGVWWSFWQAEASSAWTSATTGSGTTEAPTDGLIALSLVTEEGDAPAPRAETTLAEAGATPTAEATTAATDEATSGATEEASETPTPTATDDAADTAGDEDTGSSTGLIVGLVVLVGLAGAAWMGWRRRQTP